VVKWHIVFFITPR